MSSKLFISCDEATTICTKNQYKEATFLEKFKLSIHLLTCRICGLYSKQNGTLTKACNAHLKKEEVEHKLSSQYKKELEIKVAEHIK